MERRREACSGEECSGQKNSLAPPRMHTCTRVQKIEGSGKKRWQGKKEEEEAWKKKNEEEEVMREMEAVQNGRVNHGNESLQ